MLKSTIQKTIRLNTKLYRNVSLIRMMSKVSFPGAPASEYTEELKVLRDWPVIPTYRVVDKDGIVLKKDPGLSKETLVKMYQCMVKLNQMDRIMYEAQRQGRISFYMTSYGEEGFPLFLCIEIL
jgi:2-oxoisovalerate dehydrogenase E1 component alpha subunit